MIHVVVALCDNASQGIVPVPARIGDGNVPKDNLYWGAGFGLKTYLKQQSDWKLLSTSKPPNSIVLERLVFQHKTLGAFLVADAYRGSAIKDATTDFLSFAAGRSVEQISIAPKRRATIGGGADLLVYVGHNGLMDFKLSPPTAPIGKSRRDVAVLCCKSRKYFQSQLEQAGASPVLLTNGLMAPEGYVADSVIDGWLKKDFSKAISERTAIAYNKYQKCGIRGARNLFREPSAN